MDDKTPFRPMRRFKQQMTNEECIALLRKAPRGVLAVLGDGGYPYTVPLDFVYDDGKIYFHCAKEGHKLDAIRGLRQGLVLRPQRRRKRTRQLVVSFRKRGLFR